MRFLLLLTMVLLASCTQLTASQQGADRASRAANNDCGQPADADTAVKLGVVDELMARNRMHAALAHLDELDSEALQATYLRAEILRQSSRPDEAAIYYRELKDTCMAGWAHHGLGLIAGREDRLDQALDELAIAAELLPVEPRVRNDYGYALLLDENYEAARREFLTTLELEQGAALAETNMVLLLFANEEPDKAEAFAKRVEMDTETLSDLARQAQDLRR